MYTLKKSSGKLFIFFFFSLSSSLVKKPTSWYKSQCGSARHKLLARFYTVYSPTVGQRSFLEKKEHG
ncbi:hypothetical protein Taro_021767 [Colocasia esculenta]|uniref:Secreted protein n=1 Tax=Colocasia esculenta TaxID=4460 RepID=A0A843V246_COLES|nr:hypothetical protein [Colocasia esculenta]